jgi:UDP-GlcNAc:undecaprenyl-phosphate/decaprenyl-phosphate GlcNAc-1-phosphate transferase
MQISDIQYFTLFVFTYSLVGLLTPVMRKVAISKQILDTPTSSHKSHAQAVPYLGGVAILIGVVLVSYTALIFNGLTHNNFWLATSVLVPAVAMGLVGLWDDIKNLPPLPRLIGQSIAGLVVAALLIISKNVANPTGSTYIDVIITAIWVVGICNSINFFDNLDGGAAGTGAISAIFITYLALSNGQSFIAALSVVVAGGTLGFLIWNRTPARIYMGDAGALFLGVLLATLTIRLNPDTQTLFASFATPILLLAIPILDTCVAVFSRLRRGISPLQGGKDHLSHRLIRLGISRKLTAISLWILSIIFGLFAVIISLVSEQNEVIFVLLSILFWFLLFIGFLRTDDE